MRYLAEKITLLRTLQKRLIIFHEILCRNIWLYFM